MTVHVLKCIRTSYDNMIDSQDLAVSRIWRLERKGFLHKIYMGLSRSFLRSLLSVSSGSLYL